MPGLNDMEQRVERLETGVFGRFDEQKNAFVPGVMQIAADSASQLKQIKYAIIVFCVVAAGANPNVWKLVEAFLPK